MYYANWPWRQRTVLGTADLTTETYAIVSSVIHLRGLDGLFPKHGFPCTRSSQWRENIQWLKQSKKWNHVKNKLINPFTLALSLSSPSALCIGHSIKELYVNLALIVNGKTVLTYSETLCEPGHSKLIFCGKKKGGNLVLSSANTSSVWWLPSTPSRWHCGAVEHAL